MMKPYLYTIFRKQNKAIITQSMCYNSYCSQGLWYISLTYLLTFLFKDTERQMPSAVGLPPPRHFGMVKYEWFIWRLKLVNPQCSTTFFPLLLEAMVGFPGWARQPINVEGSHPQVILGGPKMLRFHCTATPGIRALSLQLAQKPGRSQLLLAESREWWQNERLTISWRFSLNSSLLSSPRILGQTI